MAKINIYNNCFEKDYKSIDFDENKTLLEQVEENINLDEYKENLVECYDPETQKTFYAPIEENNKPSVIITVNGKIVDENYKIKDDDIINVVYIPMGEHWGEKAIHTWNGAVIGAMYAAITIASLVPGAQAFAVMLAVGAGALTGGVLGYVIGSDLVDAKYATTTNKGQKEGNSLPDIRGGTNKSLLNNPYPFLIGKRLITPFVVGDPYTEYTNDGQDAYIRILYCAGYSPLKLTDFKLGDFYLAYNRTQGVKRDTLISGLLKGYSTEQVDDGDILDRWKNNDIELEILQHNPNKTVNHGSIYPDVKIEKEIKANILFINDDALAEQAKITYKGVDFVERFRTNTVVFTESCPMEFTVNLDASSGLYASYNRSTKDGNKTTNETKYSSIPLWFAIQWRFYDSNNNSSDSEGSDYSQWHNITVWNGNNLGQVYSDENHTADINAHKGNRITSTTSSKRVDSVINSEDLITEISSLTSLSDYSTDLYFINNSGSEENGLVLKTSDSNYKYIAKGNKNEISDNIYWARLTSDTTISKYCVYDSRTKTLWIDLSYDGNTFNDTLTSKVHSEVISYNLENEEAVTLYTYSKVNRTEQSDATGTETTVNVKYIKTVKKYHTSSMGTYYSDTGFWVGKELVNFQSYSGEDHVGEIRLSSTVQLTDEQCKEMLRNSNTIKGIEVRCVRVSPNYINETKSEASGDSDVNEGAQSYSDSIVMTTLVTKCFNKEKLQNDNVLEAVKAASDEDIKKFCYIAIKAKADVAGNIINQMKEMNCIAESFSPVYNETTHKVIPEDVKKITKYYGYYTDSTRQTKADKSSDSYEYYLGYDEEARLAYEEGRHEGFNWYAEKAGSNYLDKVDEILFPSDDSYYSTHNSVPCNILPPKAEMLNDTTAASGFLLGLVGSHNGSEASGYEDINMLSFIDTWEVQQSIKDGSTYSEDDNEHSAGDIVEVKYEANGYVYQSQKIDELLKKIEVAGRFVFTYDDKGKIKMIMDNPVDYPKGCISQQNTISLSSSYTYDDVPAGLRISFNDEKDGYESNGIYCWSDGNSLSNYKGQVNPYNFDFVTNEKQAWSLGRWVLANTLLNREVVSVKCGAEGNTFELGDVIVLQSDELLIGSGSGRVKQILEDDNYIYGFVTDSTFEYTNETEIVSGTEKSKLGFSVFQQKKTGDKISSFRIAVEGTEVTVDEVLYIQTAGETNLLLLDEFISKSSPNVYNFNIDDIVMFGYFNRNTEQFRITKVKPDKNSFTYTLLKYNEEIYNYGRALPSFQNYMTIPQPTKDGITLSEVPTTIAELNEKDSDNAAFSINSQNNITPLTSLNEIGAYIGQLGLYQSQIYKWDGSIWINTSAVLPTDPILHYSFDEVPDFPDGNAGVRLLDNNTYNIQDTGYRFLKNTPSSDTVISNDNGKLKIENSSTGNTSGVYIQNGYTKNKIIKLKFRITSLNENGVVSFRNGSSLIISSYNKIGLYELSFINDSTAQYPNFYIIFTTGTVATIVIDEIYIGDGSYNTPIIDNANGQYNAENHGGLATEGVSGKGCKIISSNGYLETEYQKFEGEISVSLWVNNNGQSAKAMHILDGRADGLTLADKQIFYTTQGGNIEVNNGQSTTNTPLSVFEFDDKWHLYTFVSNGVDTEKIYKDGVLVFESNRGDRIVTSGKIRLLNRYQITTTSATGVSLDDFQIFNRALSEEEVLGLYFARGNTPKYYSISDYQLESIDDDGVISPIEKQNLLSTWKQIYNAVNVSASLPTTSPVANGGEYKGVIDEANSLNIINTTKITAYIQSANELRSALWNVTNGYLLNMQAQSTVRTDINLDSILANYRTALQDARTAIGQQQSAIASALGVSNSNPFCLIPVNATTGNPNYENTGTTLQLFNGTTELTPIISGTLVDNQWKVTASGTNISQSINGTIPTGTKQIVYGNVSAFAANETNATVTYTIQARINGVTNTIYTTQKFAKAQEGADGRIYDLRTENGTIVKSPTGNLTPSTVTVKAYSWTASNSPALFASGDLKAFENGVQRGSTVSQGSSITVTPSGNYPVLVQLLKHGTNTILDEMNIPVLTEVKGDKGDTGASVGNQILRGTNSLTEFVTSGSTWANKKWRTASATTGTRTIVNITDCPDPNLVKGINILGGGTNHCDVAQDSVPLLSGIEYTMSCWAKADSTTHTPKLYLQWYKDSTHSGGTSINLTTSWSKYSFTFTPTVDNPNIYFGSLFTVTDSTTNVKICGMKVELGNTATDWCEYEYDKNGKKIKISDYPLRTWSASQWTQYSTEGNIENWYNTFNDLDIGDILIVPAKLSSEGNIIGQSYNEVTGVPYVSGNYWATPCKVLYGVKGEKGATGNTGKATHVSDFASTRTWTNAQWNDYSTKGRSSGWSNVTGSPTIKIGDTFIVYATLSEQGNIIGQVYCEVTGITGSGSSWTITSKTLYGVKGEKGQTGAPGERGFSSRTIAFRANHDSFSTVNKGEVYVCGYNANGAESDTPGYVIVDGTTYYAKGMVNTNIACDGYLVIPTTSTSSSSPSVPRVAYLSNIGSNMWYVLKNGQTSAYTENITDANLGNWIVIGKMYMDSEEGNTQVEPVTPCKLSTVTQPFNYYFEGIVSTVYATVNNVSNSLYHAKITPYKIVQNSSTSYSVSALTDRYARRGAIVLQITNLTSTPSAATIYFFNGAYWNTISSSDSRYYDIISLMAGSLPVVAGYYVSKGQPVPSVCGTYIDTLTSNIAIINKIFSQKITLLTGGSFQSENYKPYIEGFVKFDRATSGTTLGIKYVNIYLNNNIKGIMTSSVFSVAIETTSTEPASSRFSTKTNTELADALNATENRNKYFFIKFTLGTEQEVKLTYTTNAFAGLKLDTAGNAEFGGNTVIGGNLNVVGDATFGKDCVFNGGAFNSINADQAILSNTLLRLTLNHIIVFDSSYTLNSMLSTLESKRSEIQNKFGDVDSYVNGCGIFNLTLTSGGNTFYIKTIQTPCIKLLCNSTELTIQMENIMTQKRDSSGSINVISVVDFELKYDKSSGYWYVLIRGGSDIATIQIPNYYEEGIISSFSGRFVYNL